MRGNFQAHQRAYCQHAQHLACYPTGGIARAGRGGRAQLQFVGPYKGIARLLRSGLL